MSKVKARLLMETSMWFSEFPSSVISTLIESSEFRSFSKGEIIHQEFGKEELNFIISGSVWVNLKEKNTNMKLGLVLPSELIGIIEVVDKYESDVPHFNYIAAQDSQTLAIPKSVFINSISTSNYQLKRFLDTVIRYFHISVLILTKIHNGPIKNRILTILNHFIQIRNKDSLIDNPIIIDLTQEDISAIVKSSRQLVNKALNKLEEEKILRVGYKRIEIIDVNKLISQNSHQIFND